MASSDWKREVVENVPLKELAKPKVVNFKRGVSFKTLKKEVKTNFQDKDFPPVNTPTLYKRQKTADDNPNWPQAKWKHMPQICAERESGKKPTFLSEKKDKKNDDVIQGDIADCYFLSAFALIANRREALNKVVPKGQGSVDDDYKGMFRFRFWQFGTWVEVVIDDLLPTYVNPRSSNKKPPITLFARTHDRLEFGVSLAEKAYAKLYGSYEGINGGLTMDALVDMTGGVAVRCLFKDWPGTAFTALSGRMRKAIRTGSFVALGTTDAEGPSGQKKGLTAHHSYAVTQAEVVEYKGEKLELFRLRNPWGRQIYEWTGTWSDKDDANWALLSAKDKKTLGYPTGEGDWYMSYEDMAKHFDNVTICSVGPDFDEDGVPQTKGYQHSYAKGSWAGSLQNDGGSFKQAGDDALRNPQYLLRLSNGASDADGRSSVFIALMQRYTGSLNEGRNKLRIGYRLFKVEKRYASELRQGRGRVPPHNANRLTVIESLDECDALREVTVQTDFVADQDYLYIPFTFNRGEEEDYLVRIFSEDPISMVELK